MRSRGGHGLWPVSALVLSRVAAGYVGSAAGLGYRGGLLAAAMGFRAVLVRGAGRPLCSAAATGPGGPAARVGSARPPCWAAAWPDSRRLVRAFR